MGARRLSPANPSAQADLTPAAVLNFRVATAELFDPPYLRANLRADAQQLSSEALPQGSGGLAPTCDASRAQPVPNAERAVPKWAPGAR